jgi:hypothetical protein
LYAIFLCIFLCILSISPEEVAAVNANRRLEYAALEGEALARVRNSNNFSHQRNRESETDAERETRMTNLNALRRDLRKRRADDVEVVDVTACAGLVENTSIPSKRRT